MQGNYGIVVKPIHCQKPSVEDSNTVKSWRSLLHPGSLTLRVFVAVVRSPFPLLFAPGRLDGCVCAARRGDRCGQARLIPSRLSGRSRCQGVFCLPRKGP